ncbi:MAG: cell envelope integrity protein TolA [Xanthomonadales bacterium]|nr:cell envelope integrity protein TolA [Xanthomonadales bacterium]
MTRLIPWKVRAGADSGMRELWAQTKAFTLAIAVHLLMAALVVVGTMTWKPFKPPALTGMTIEAVMVDTSAIKERREQTKREAEKAVAQKVEKDRRAKDLQERKERQERERQEQEAAEKQRQKDQAVKKRQEDMRLQELRKKQEQDRKDQLKRQKDELEQMRNKREDAARQRKIEEERLKQLDARRQADADAQRQAVNEAEMRQEMAAEQREFRAGQLATKGDEYYAAIQSQVTNNWLRPPTARPGLRCRLKIVQIPGGEVISAAIAGKCNADEATRRSLEAAVERTGSLPYRGFEDVFEREIDFIFTYDDD